MPGITELGIIAGIVVFLFGGSKIPKLAGSVGEAIRNFRSGVKEIENELD